MIREKTQTGPSETSGGAIDRRALSEKGKLVYKEQKRWLFLGLPFTFTTSLMYENDIKIKSGLLSCMKNAYYLYLVIDVQLQMSF